MSDRQERRGYWMQTYTGVPWFFDEPRWQEVSVVDIAHALSNLCRYGGHCRSFYSVAEHSILVSRMVPPEHAFCGLMHDATEAYVVDVPRPLKRRLADYKHLEAFHWAAIARRFDLPEVIPDAVEEVDGEMLFVERDQLLGELHDETGLALEWGMGRKRVGLPNPPVLQFLNPADAERAFLDRFKELTV